MLDQFPWAEGLSIPQSQVQAWLEKLPPGETLLKWCIESKNIDPTRYLRWAAEHYALPFVKTDFFLHLPLGLDGIRALIPEKDRMYSPYFFPIHEWDDVIFIGCVQPSEHLPQDINCQQILASPTDLQQLWARLHGQDIISNLQIPDPPAEKTPEVVPTPAAIEPAEENVQLLQPFSRPAARGGALPAAFAKLTPPFERAMILIFHEDHLKVWKWHGPWKPPSRQDPISLNENSIFRIACESLQPYHGYVVSNTVNGKFFRDWLDDQQPAHVTIVPMIKKDVLCGLLLATASIDPQPPTSLELAQRVALECQLFLPTQTSISHAA